MNKVYLLKLCPLHLYGCLEDAVTDDNVNVEDNQSQNGNSDTSEGNNDTSGNVSWTFMTYISDSDLEYFAIEDMIEMERVGSTDNVNIVVQIDRWDGYDKPDWNDDSNGDWEPAKDI